MMFVRSGAPRLSAVALFAALVSLIPSPAASQGTMADYVRASELRERFQGKVVDQADRFSWIDGTHQLTYRTSVEGGYRFLLVDAATGDRSAAFDHGRLATALTTATGESYSEITLPFNQIELNGAGDQLRFEIGNTDWSCDLNSYRCSADDGSAANRGGGGNDDDTLVSPDGRWEAIIDNFNVVIRSVATGDVTLMSTDGSEGDYYQASTMEWSPDSQKLAVYRVTPGYQRRVHYIESSPEDQVQPKYSNRLYLKPGDQLMVEKPVLFNLETGQSIIVDRTLFPNAYSQTDPSWWDDSRAFYFEYNQRGHQAYKIIEVNAETGEARALVDEQEDTFFSYYSTLDRAYTENGAEIIWMSERDGWKHLYLYDGYAGTLKNQVTSGEWVVRELDYVDEEARQIYFRASGMNPDQDPYLMHHYRINFDGTDLVALTEGDGNHSLVWSDDREFYVDTWSRVDLAPISQLRRASDRSVVTELGRSDVSALEAEGWKAPQPFVAKGRDGVTDIWGIIIRPTNFDPNQKYPVIEYIYAGPHNSHVPKSFSPYNSMMGLADLGFVVVQIDGMGTANRSKAFHDVAWKNLKDAGFPDRIEWHETVASTYPWYDNSRVGIYGHSAGGQNSLGALLFYPDHYHVAVSSAGCHDNRMDKISWNEQWMGWPVGPEYAESSNVDNAWRLKGKVLLKVGELDTNVPPTSTLQVVDALINADKDFDLLFLPGAGHTTGGEYGERKRWDYFVEHLLEVTPPQWNLVEAAAPDGA